MNTRKLMTIVATVALLATFCFTANAEQDKVDKLIAQLIEQIDANANASEEVKAFAKEKLVPLCTNGVFTKEAKAQNDKKTSLDEIKKIDQQWQEAEEELAIQEEKLNNTCAKEIAGLAKKHNVIIEAFVMDNQGAVVGENLLTSDYWQGDEGKWQNSFNKGKGGVDVGEAEFDGSANAVLQQVSLPVIDAEGKVIGAVTYGVAVDRL